LRRDGYRTKITAKNAAAIHSKSNKKSTICQKIYPKFGYIKIRINIKKIGPTNFNTVFI